MCRSMHTPQPLPSLRQWEMELPGKLSGCQGQKGEGLLGQLKSSGLIYIHRQGEL